MLFLCFLWCLFEPARRRLPRIAFQISKSPTSRIILGMQLALEKIAKRYGSRIALDDVSLAVAPGEIVALAGLNGAGKTTLVRIMLGLVSPDQGRADPGAAPRPFGGVGYLPEETRLPPEITAREWLTETLRLAGRRNDARIRRCAEETGIAEFLDLRPRAYSKGMGRRVSLAIALVAEPRFVVLDEPQSGLDPVGRRDLLRLLTSLRAEGVGVLVATHDLNEIEKCADRALLIHRGRIRADIPRSSTSVASWIAEPFYRLVDEKDHDPSAKPRPGRTP